MKRASGQWLESAQMDLGGVEQIIRRGHLAPAGAFHPQQCVGIGPAANSISNRSRYGVPEMCPNRVWGVGRMRLNPVGRLKHEW
jgi:hypothetical protein